MNEVDITQSIPPWIRRHDHLFKIPQTNSFVFYPYNLIEANEEELNKYYNKYGYTVVRKPKVESEYKSDRHATYKVLILESDYDELSVEQGCEILAQKLKKHFSEILEHRVSEHNSVYDDMDRRDKTRRADDPVDNRRINDAWNYIIKCALDSNWTECADACIRLNDVVTPQFQIEIDSEKYVEWGPPQYEGESDCKDHAPHVCVPGKCDELPILHANCWQIARFGGHGCSLYHSISQPDGTLDVGNVGIFPEPPRDTGLDKWCFDVIRVLADYLGNWHLEKLYQQHQKNNTRDDGDEFYDDYDNND